MIRAICIGEAMVELRPVGDGLYARGFAGDVLNTAVYLDRALREGGQVAFQTVVGDDQLSAELTAAVAAHGLDVTRICVASGGVCGLYMIELDADGERTFTYWRSASAARGWYRALRDAAPEAAADLIYVSGVSLAILAPDERLAAVEHLAALREAGGRLAFDPNVRPKLWGDLAQARRVVEAAAAAADIVLPSDQDGRLLWGEDDAAAQADRWLELGAGEVALTCGAAGAVLRAPGLREAVPAPRAEVVDTSGAGDSFNGAYLAARLAGESPLAAGRAGVGLASRVVGARGAIVPVEVSHPHLQSGRAGA